MTDRELLESAAKAAGLTLYEHVPGLIVTGSPETKDVDYERWNPLDDDGDAMRLAVKLNIGIAFCFHRQTVTAGRWHALHEHRIVPFGHDKEAATRLAVVHSAAAIGKDMP